MKIFVIIICLLLGGAVSAQRYSQRNNPQIERDHAMQGRDKEPNPDDQLDKFMVEMTTQLELNGLQEAAIRNILKEQMRQNKALQASGQPDSQKQDEARQVTEKTDKEIKALLDAPQIEKYEKMKQDMRAGKKPKKKKKKHEPEHEPHE